jgi:hypothetical protein
MNPTVPPFAGAKPVLKLPRRPAAKTLREIESGARWQMASELDELRRREANLADYEARLKAWQAQLDACQRTPAMTAAPFVRPGAERLLANDPVLNSAWGRLYRARELLEAEQRHVRDERIAQRETELRLKRREAELDAREADLVERERAVHAAEKAIAARKVGAVLRRVIRGPVRALRR